jgi:4-hydroxysphinganine ceramide fatty acyl 2-hydroxylase
MERAYVSTSTASVRMFKNEFVEFCSKVHPAVPLVIYLPFVAVMLYVARWHNQLPVLTIVGLFVLGMLLWTLFEYVVHRFVFHYEPKSRLGKRLHFIIHGVHHDYPNDARRLVMPPSVSIPVAFVMYFLFAALFGRFAPVLSAGFAFGYVCYDSMHYATHHFSAKRGVFAWLKRYHLHHHFKDDARGYGISSPLWDYVFGTARK